MSVWTHGHLFYTLDYNEVLHCLFFAHLLRPGTSEAYSGGVPCSFAMSSSLCLFESFHTFWPHKLFWLILCIPYSKSGICHFSKKALVLALGEWYKTQDLGARFLLMFDWFPELDSQQWHYHIKGLPTAHISHFGLELPPCSCLQMGFNGTNVVKTRTIYNFRALCLALYYCLCWALPTKLLAFPLLPLS